MTAQKRTIVYNDWSGGTWGSKGAVRAAEETPKLYRSQNLQVYSNGSLGPRPGWKLVSTSGTAPAPTTGYGHAVSRWIPYTGTTYGYLLFGSGVAGETKRLNLDTLAWSTTVLGSLTAYVDDGLQEMNPVCVAWVNTRRIVVGGTKVYDIGTDTLVATISFPSSFVPTHSCFYRDRHYAWGDPSFPNRVYYSDASAYTTFNAGQYFDVGSGGGSSTTSPRIHGIYPLRDGLLIYTTEFAFSSTNQRNVEGDWYLLQGANPVTGTLRALGRTKVPSAPSIATIYNNNLIGMDYDTGRGVFLHNGSDLDMRSLAHLRPGYELVSRAGSRAPVVLYGEPSIVMPYAVAYSDSVDPTRNGTEPVGYVQEDGMQALALVHGTWNKELWWNGAIDKTITTVTPFVWNVTDFQADKLLAVTNATADGYSGTWRVYSRDVCLDRPGKSDDTWSSGDEVHADSTGSGVNAQLWLPSEQAPVGAGVKVRRVTVDFDYWKEATFSPASTADMALKVRAQGLAGDTYSSREYLPQNGQAGAFNFLPATTGRAPKRGRYTFFLPEMPFSAEFQVIFTSIRNCAIHTVTVDTEVETKAAWS